MMNFKMRRNAASLLGSASYGCIRMRSQDVVRVFKAVSVGTKIDVINAPLRRAIAEAYVNHRLRSARVAAN